MDPPPILPFMPNRYPKKPSRDVFPILSLPAELRIQIYEAAFILPIEIDATYRKPSPQPYLIPAALLRTCRQIYSEAYGMLYEHNTFRVGSRCDEANYGIAWLSRIGNNVKLIRKVVIDIHKNKTESRVLPFTVFLFELRTATPRLEELSVFVEKHRGGVLTGQIMIVNELQKFSNLKRLTLGGEWKSFFGTWPEDVFPTLKERHDNVYFVEAGSQAWVERQDCKKTWEIKIADEAREIQWRVGIERVICWADEWTKDLSDDLRFAWEDWMQEYFYAESEEDQRLVLQRGRELVLNSKAYNEKRLRGTECNCRDCKRIRARSPRRGIGLTCYDIHEKAIDGTALFGQALQDLADGDRVEVSGGTTLAQTWEVLEGRKMTGIPMRGPPEKTMNGSQQPKMSQTEKNSRSREVRWKEDVKRWRDDVKDNSETLMAVPQRQALPTRSPPPAEPRAESVAKSRLRRETRYWYGRSPLAELEYRYWM